MGKTTQTVRSPIPTIGQVALEAIDGTFLPLDTNPNAGSGLRIFPDKRTPTDTVNRARVRVKANADWANAKIYFRSFDLDDPSTDAAPVDTNGTAANDNKGAGQTGTITASNSETAPNGLIIPYALTDASRNTAVELITTKQPGDNFMVVASSDLAYISGIVADGLTLRDSTGNALNATKAKPTQMLTVWRKLHIEVDSMGAVAGNVVTGTITGVAANYTIKGCGDPRKPCRDLTKHTVYVDQTLDDMRYGDGVSANSPQGRMIVNGVAYSVFFNQTRNLGIRTPTNVPPPIGASFVLYDDDDFNDSGIYQGDDGEDVDLLADTLQTIQASDDASQNVFSPAYIRPDYTYAQGRGYNTSTAQFTLNVLLGTANLDGQIYTGWNSFNDESDDFWMVYLQAAYQHDTPRDNDPNSESAVGGVTPTYAGLIDSVINSSQVPLGADGTLMFMEVVRDYVTRNGGNLRTQTAPHEIGHQFGLKGDTAMGFGLMSYDDTEPQIFVPEHLNVLRWRVKSPGFQ